ncbi:MAG: hypothetical protein ACQEXI_12470 [Pseudomonadota bacterium]
MSIDATLKVQEISAVGFPYHLFTFRWEALRWRVARQEIMSCLVDRLQGISTTLESVEFGDAPRNSKLPSPLLDGEGLEHKARQQVLLVRRHRLKRRGTACLELISQQPVRKPLWRVEVDSKNNGIFELLLDGMTGGYYVM